MNGYPYTAAEDAIIVENYQNGLIPEWAHLLPGRTIGAIKGRVGKLGLSTTTDRDKKLQSRAINRFFSRIKKNDVTGCWEWAGTVTNFGHGLMGANGKAILVHRFSWIHHYGAIPEGMQVCHHCDIPCCVNPDHLFLATCKGNMRNCSLKGRKLKNGPASSVSEKLKDLEYKKSLVSKVAILGVLLVNQKDADITIDDAKHGATFVRHAWKGEAQP